MRNGDWGSTQRSSHPEKLLPLGESRAAKTLRIRKVLKKMHKKKIRQRSHQQDWRGDAI